MQSRKIAAHSHVTARYLVLYMYHNILLVCISYSRKHELGDRKQELVQSMGKPSPSTHFIARYSNDSAAYEIQGKFSSEGEPSHRGQRGRTESPFL